MTIILLLDIDGTLTPAREPIRQEMVEVLKGLLLPFSVAAGSDLPLVKEQFLDPLAVYGFKGNFDAFVSNGTSRIRCSYGASTELRKLDDFDFHAHISEAGFERLVRVLMGIVKRPEFNIPADIQIIGPQITDRRSMINFAPIGRPSGKLTEAAKENRARFRVFDSGTRFRERLLASLQEELRDLKEENELVIMIGGETSFDIVVAGQDKTKPVRILLAEGYERIVFLGDALSGFGNDSVIRKYIEDWTGEGQCPVEAIEVKEWQQTIEVLIEKGWAKVDRLKAAPRGIQRAPTTL